MTSAAPPNVGGTGQDVGMSSIHDRNNDDRSLHRVARRPVTRVPTPAMRTAPFHLGAVIWANPWEATDEGAMFRWVIARHDVLQGNTEFIEGSERASAPEARLVTNIEAMLGEDPTLTWIGVPASRLALFRQLEAAQLEATCGGEHNFGLERAVILMQQRTAEAMRRANLATWPKLPHAGRRTSQGERSPRLLISEPKVSRSALGSAMSLIACDGSFNLTTGIGAYAVVSSDGATHAATGVCSHPAATPSSLRSSQDWSSALSQEASPSPSSPTHLKPSTDSSESSAMAAIEGNPPSETGSETHDVCCPLM